MEEEKPKKKRKKKSAAEGDGTQEKEARKRMLAYDARPESELGNDANDEFDEIF